MKSTELINKVEPILEQVIQVIKSRRFGNGVTAVYYAGGTLCVDVYDKARLSAILMINICNETVNIYNAETKQDTKRLLSLKSLKLAFLAYELKKGKNDYYNKCYQKSCLRNLIVDNLN
jgi:hypothetical protein